MAPVSVGIDGVCYKSQPPNRWISDHCRAKTRSEFSRPPAGSRRLDIGAHAQDGSQCAAKAGPKQMVPPGVSFRGELK